VELDQWDPQQFVEDILISLCVRKKWLEKQLADGIGHERKVMASCVTRVETVIANFERVADVERPAEVGGGAKWWNAGEMKAWLEGWHKDGLKQLKHFVSITRAQVEAVAPKLDDNVLLTPEQFQASKTATKRKRISWANALANCFYMQQHSAQLTLNKYYIRSLSD